LKEEKLQRAQNGDAERLLEQYDHLHHYNVVMNNRYRVVLLQKQNEVKKAKQQKDESEQCMYSQLD
jgi:hypothetical protein